MGYPSPDIQMGMILFTLHLAYQSTNGIFDDLRTMHGRSFLLKVTQEMSRSICGLSDYFLSAKYKEGMHVGTA